MNSSKKSPSQDEQSHNKSSTISCKTVNICGIKHTAINYDQAILIFSEWIRKPGKSHQVCVSNVHTTVMGFRDKQFSAITNNASMVTIDGQPLRWYANLICDAQMEDRVAGPDLMLKCFELGQEKKWKHFLFGGRDTVLEKLCQKLLVLYPEASIVGRMSPPFHPLSDAEIEEIVETINDASPDFLWVGLGAPKQEKWISDNLNKIHVPLIIGVGAAFDFISGAVQRAPAFIQKIGLEWLFRIVQSPGIAKRYLTTNPIFLYMFIRDLLKKYLLKFRTH